MKLTIKILGVLFVITSLVSCDNSDDLKYNPSVEKGWVQFLEDSPAVVGVFQGANAELKLDVNIQVPTTSSDLTINYDMVSVSGANPSSVFSNNGKTIAPAGSTSHAGPDNGTGFDYAYLAEIDFDLSELEGTVLTEPMVFDVVLTGTSSSLITAGISEVPAYPTSRRIVIYPSLDGFVGTYTVTEGFIAGPNAPFGLGDFFGESYQVELARMPGDDTASKFVITNSAGFDVYFIEGTELTFGLDGGLSFYDGNSEDGFPVVALFNIFEFESSSFDYGLNELTATGPLSTYGDYQFVLTKQ